jgi:hypothetical protein
MSDTIARPPKRRLRRRALVLAFTLVLGGFTLWHLTRTPATQDLVFRGKPESEWIKNLKYLDDDQVKEWRGYGEEGVQVLIRGLKRANHPRERMYRQFNRSLPGPVRRHVPAPKPDSTQGTRQCIVSLISHLGTAATSAIPVMVWTVRKDESDSVVQSALGFFNSSEDDNCILNRLPPGQKAALLSPLLRAIQNSANWGLRNNAAMSLRFYPEQRKVVTPVLLNGLKDPHPQVQLLAAEALIRVDPAAASKAGVTSIMVAISKNPDDQIASRAVAALGRPGSQLDLAVPAIVECLRSTNSLVACQAVWTLEWAGKEFETYSNTIVPALFSAAERTNNAAGYARNALARWTRSAAAGPSK